MATTALYRTRCKQRDAKPETEAEEPQFKANLDNIATPCLETLKKEKEKLMSRRKREGRKKKRMKNENQN